MSHPLDGPRLKVRRAESQIDLLRKADDTFREKANYRLIQAELDTKRRKQHYRILINVLPALEWGVCIGEIAHNLHSALNGLTWQLALFKTKTAAANTQFPIFLVGRTKKRRRGRRSGLIPHFEGMELSDGRSMIRNLLPEHQTAVERLQPYKRGNGGVRNPLYRLR